MYETLQEWINKEGLSRVLEALSNACAAVSDERKDYRDGTSEEYYLASKHLSDKSYYWSDI